MRSFGKSRSPVVEDRRRSPRHALNRMAQIVGEADRRPRECLVTDISEGGVRIFVEGYQVPDEFILLLTGDGVAPEQRTYRVVWRLGSEIGAKFVGIFERPRLTARG